MQCQPARLPPHLPPEQGIASFTCSAYFRVSFLLEEFVNYQSGTPQFCFVLQLSKAEKK